MGVNLKSSHSILCVNLFFVSFSPVFLNFFLSSCPLNLSSLTFVYFSHPAWMIPTESKELRSLSCCLCQQKMKSTDKCSAEVHV